jgi:serine protease Do
LTNSRRENEDEMVSNKLRVFSVFAMIVSLGRMIFAHRRALDRADGGWRPPFDVRVGRVLSIFPAIAFLSAAAAGQSAALPNVADVVDKAMPSVVRLQALEEIKPTKPSDKPKSKGESRPPLPARLGGSGFIISADGWIVTNYHVVEGARNVTVHLGNRWVPALVKGVDPETDLAVVKIETDTALKFLPLGDSDALRVGEWVITIGSPLNLEQTVTAGIVSAKGRSLSIGTLNSGFSNLIQIDAAINYGNSGGPLLNMKGEVIGVNTAINDGANNIGFAVPIKTLKNILPQLREQGKVNRGYMGMRLTELTYELARGFGLASPEGVLVLADTPDSPSGRAGIKHGDIVLAVDGLKVKNQNELINYIAGKSPGTAVKLDVFRDGKQMPFSFTLTERPNEQVKPQTPVNTSHLGPFGLAGEELTPSVRAARNIGADVSGVVITDLDPFGSLAEQAVRRGDVITEVNRIPITTLDEFNEILDRTKSGDYVPLYIRRFDAKDLPQDPFEFFFNKGKPRYAVIRIP